MWNRVIVMVVVSTIAGLGCGGKKKASPGGGQKDQNDQMAPARPSPEAASIRKRLALSVPEKERYAALVQLVKGWPRTRGALSAALGLVRADKENRGGYAMSLAGLGRPLVPALNQMVARSPRHLPTLRAGGALSYHLVARSRASKLTDADLAALRRALRPTFLHMWAMFLTDNRPDYEIYQGVAVGAQEAIRRFRLSVAKDQSEGKLTRVAMVLHLILSNKPSEALLPAAELVRLRQRAAIFAKPFAEALLQARPDGSGESPASLLLGLSVLGVSAARALVAVLGSGKPAGCLMAVKSAQGLLDQFPASAVAPLRPVIQRCVGLKWTANPEVAKSLKMLLAKVPAPGGKP